MVESGRVPGKGRIIASIEKLSRRVLKKGQIYESSEKRWNPGDYREKVEFVRVSKNCPNDYRKNVESVWLPKNGRIQASTGKNKIRASIEKLSRRVMEKGRICVSTEKW